MKEALSSGASFIFWKIWAVTTLITASSLTNLMAQEVGRVKYRLESESRLWIEGSSTIGSYSCGTDHVIGSAFLRNPESRRGAIKAQAYEGSSDARLSVVVRKLDCGNSRMNEDMYEAMKVDSFSTIQYTLLGAEVLPDSTPKGGWFKLATRGLLTIAGTTNSVEIIVNVKELQRDTFCIVGSKELSMHDFNIVPPTAFWGLIRADSKLVVNFSLIAIPEFVQTAGQKYEPGY